MIEKLWRSERSAYTPNVVQPISARSAGAWTAAGNARIRGPSSKDAGNTNGIVVPTNAAARGVTPPSQRSVRGHREADHDRDAHEREV